MGQFGEFELRLEKIGDYPLEYNVPIPETSQFFQDVRRYQHASSPIWKCVPLMWMAGSFPVLTWCVCPFPNSVQGRKRSSSPI